MNDKLKIYSVSFTLSGDKKNETVTAKTDKEAVMKLKIKYGSKFSLVSVKQTGAQG